MITNQESVKHCSEHIVSFENRSVKNQMFPQDPSRIPLRGDLSLIMQTPERHAKAVRMAQKLSSLTKLRF